MRFSHHIKVNYGIDGNAAGTASVSYFCKILSLSRWILEGVSMKFESEKSWFSGTVIWGTTLLMFFLMLQALIRYDHAPVWLLLFLLLPVALLLWIWFYTHYTLKDGQLYYVSGPIKGKINVTDIRQVVLNQSIWSGLKPALAFNGIIIRYNRFDEIYISPRNKDGFIQELIKINSEIQVISG